MSQVVSLVAVSLVPAGLVRSGRRTLGRHVIRLYSVVMKQRRVILRTESPNKILAGT